jgi:hypothetical protein
MGSLATAAVAALLFLSFSSGSLGTALADERFAPADEEALIDIINTGMTLRAGHRARYLRIVLEGILHPNVGRTGGAAIIILE